MSENEAIVKSTDPQKVPGIRALMNLSKIYGESDSYENIRENLIESDISSWLKNNDFRARKFNGQKLQIPCILTDESHWLFVDVGEKVVVYSSKGEIILKTRDREKAFEKLTSKGYIDGFEIAIKPKKAQDIPDEKPESINSDSQ